MIKKSTLKRKILGSFFIAILPLFVMLIMAVELLLVPYFENQAKSELRTSTELLCNAVKSGAHVAIRNHLKALAEQNLAVVEHYYSLYETGVITKSEALSSLRSILLSQKIGTSGYLYCVNSKGVVVVHPNSGVENEYQLHFKFVRDQIKLKQGYLEYDWKNPGEISTRPKALYMVYFEPLDWIISVSSYRNEFNELINPDDFKETVNSVKFGKSGYAYILDSNGVTLLHPQLHNYNIFEHRYIRNDFVKFMLNNQSGVLNYEWKNPKDKYPLEKMAFFAKIPELGWTVVSSVYSGEVLEPIRLIRIFAYSALGFLFMAVFATSIFLSKRLTKPLSTIISKIDQNTLDGTYSLLPILSDDEIGKLACEINKFLEVVENQNKLINKEREKYQHLFQTSPDGIFLIKNMKVIDCNPATLSIFEGQYNEIIGKSIEDLSPILQPNGKNSAEYAKEILSECADLSIMQFEWEHQRSDRTNFYAEIRLMPYYDENKELLYVTFIRNITESKQWESKITELNEQLELKVIERTVELNEALKIIEDSNIELKQLNDNIVDEARKLLILNEKLALSEQELQVANKTKDRFFSIIAHDLKNPIGGMRSLIEVLSLYYKKMTSEEIEPIISTLYSSSNLTVELLENLLQWARIQTNKIEFNASYNNILNQAEKNKNLANAFAKNKNIHIHIDIPEKLQATFDTYSINTVFRNLISNAVKFTTNGGNVYINAKDKGNIIEVSIKDDGIGMPIELSRKLFEIENAITNPGTAGEKGTGLGLILCKDFVELNGGTIWVESTEGVGTTFFFTLPK